MKERVANAVLWIEERRKNVRDWDWDEIWPTIGILSVVAAVSLLVVIVTGVLMYGDLSKMSNRFALHIYLMSLAMGWSVVLWWRVGIWGRLVRWANTPQRVAEGLRKSK